MTVNVKMRKMVQITRLEYLILYEICYLYKMVVFMWHRRIFTFGQYKLIVLNIHQFYYTNRV